MLFLPSYKTNKLQQKSFGVISFPLTPETRKQAETLLQQQKSSCQQTKDFILCFGNENIICSIKNAVYRKVQSPEL